MSSWGEDLNLYASVKRQAPQPEPIERFTRATKPSRVLRERREYDIVSNSIPETTRREAYEASTAQLAETHVKRGIAKEMSAANHGYNIITMRPRFGMDEAAIEAMGATHGRHGKRTFVTHTDYDVVTMQPIREAVLEAEAAAKEAVLRRASRRPQRQMNILSHRYVANHEERAEAEEEERRRKLEIIADAESKYNPVSCKFRRLDAEEKVEAEKAAKEEALRQSVADHTYRVSTLVGRSEGHAYDVVCNHLYNPEYVLRLEQQAACGIPHRARMRQAWEQQRDVDEAVRESDAQRAMNRTSSERIKGLLRRGHDILSNKPFGFAHEEVREHSIVEDISVKEATIRPVKPLSMLAEKTVLERLEDSGKQKTWSTTDVVRESGPRTTLERVFHSAPSKSLLAASTFDGRSSLLLPSLDQKISEKRTNSMRQFW